MKFLSLTLLLLCSLINNAVSQNKHTAPLSDIIKIVSNSWQTAAADNKTGFELSKVTASFTVSKTLSAEGGINIWNFKIGRKVSRQTLHKMTLELETKEIKAYRSLKTDFAKELTNYIKAAFADLQKIKDSGWLPKLGERKLTLEIGLTITKSTTLGGAYEIGIFSLSAEGSKSREQGHSLILEFKNKE